MGFDKASLTIDGVALAVRVASTLTKVVWPVVEVGPGVTGLPVAAENDPGSGPLTAMVAGKAALGALGHEGPALVLACDLPLVTEAVIRMLADWPGTSSVVPLVGGHPQPLAARWSSSDQRVAETLVESGARSMRSLLDRQGVVLAGPDHWLPGVSAADFSDADSPEDLDRLGLSWSAGRRRRTGPG